METFNNSNQEMAALEVTEKSRNYLKTASFWSKLMAILQFVIVGFMVLAALVMLTTGSFLGDYSEIPIPFSLIGLFYLVLAVLIFFPSLYLYRFAKKAVNALTINDTLELEGAFKNMKCYWKFIGIMTIAMIVCSITIVPIIVIATVASAVV
jgi:hypothetical protein